MQRVLHTITSDNLTTNPRRLAHAHPTTHEPGPGCFAPCGYVWRNQPNDGGKSKNPPCPKCMNLDMNGLITSAHTCTKES